MGSCFSIPSESVRISKPPKNVTRRHNSSYSAPKNDNMIFMNMVAFNGIQGGNSDSCNTHDSGGHGGHNGGGQGAGGCDGGGDGGHSGGGHGGHGGGCGGGGGGGCGGGGGGCGGGTD
ncbi:hypothetical protein QL285_076962 [Trifolium repens]|nr:hypothetical protein QL285_076962 [Trifolium repens]